MGQRVGTPPTQRSYTFPEEEIKEREKWSILFGGSSGLLSLAHMEFLVGGSFSSTNHNIPVGQTGSLSFCLALRT